MSAHHVFAHLELLGNSTVYLVERQPDLQPQVTATMFLSSAPTAVETSKATASENIAEHREDVVDIHAGCAKVAEASEASGCIEAELVVLLPLLWVVQHIVSLCGLLELFLGFLVAGVAVRMILDGYLSVSLLYLIGIGRLADAQHFVVVSFLCHRVIVPLPPWRGESLFRLVYILSAGNQSPFPSCRRPSPAP